MSSALWDRRAMSGQFTSALTSEASSAPVPATHGEMVCCAASAAAEATALELDSRPPTTLTE